jgi:hypothetical protein
LLVTFERLDETMMKTASKTGFVSLAMLCGLGWLVVACPASLDDRCAEGACVGGGTQGEGGPIPEGGGADVVQPPDGCNVDAEPTSAPLCVVSEYGVFVAPGAKGDGSKQMPLGTIQQAIDVAISKGLPRVYVCEGDYPENIVIKNSVSLFGGFTCSWGKATKNPRVVPTTTGYAAAISGVQASVSEPMVVADLEFVGLGATAPGESSVGVFILESGGIHLRRIAVSAGSGQPGAAGAPFTSNASTTVLTGHSGVDTAGATKNDCACASYGSSTGGAGGNGGTAVVADGQPGLSGTAAPANPPATPPFDGKGGGGAPNPTGNCQNGAFGAVGTARKGGNGATSFGTPSSNGWTPGNGTDGEAGNAGQGGGGGGGDNLAGGGGGGGGGGCGGCGGGAGRAGQGGGASIALLSTNSQIVIEASQFSTEDGAKGGDGSSGESGAGGGGGGAVGKTGACGGREGGAGAGGGGGGGGAGGPSIGIAFSGPAPLLDGTAATTAKTHAAVKKLGAGGPRGVHGGGGAARIGGVLAGLGGADGTDGLPGDAFAMWHAP